MTPEKLIVVLGLAVLGGAMSGLLFHFLTKLRGGGKNGVTTIVSVAEVCEPIAPSIDPISAMNKKVSELATIQMSMFLDLKAMDQASRPDLEAFMNDLDDRLKPLLSLDYKSVPEPAATADELAAALSDALSAASQRNASELEKTVAPLLNRLERIELAMNKTNVDGPELLALVSERLNAELAPLAGIRTELTGFKATLVARISVEVDRIVDAIADGNAISKDRERAFSNEIKSTIDNLIEKISAHRPDADDLAEQVSARLISTAGLAPQAGHLSFQGGRPSLVVPFIDQTEKARAVLGEPATARSAAEFIRNHPGLAEILSEATGKTGTLDRGSDCFDIPVTG